MLEVRVNMERISTDKDIERIKEIEKIEERVKEVTTILDKYYQSAGFKNHEDWENKRRDHYKSLDPNEIKRLLNFVSTTY